MRTLCIRDCTFETNARDQESLYLRALYDMVYEMVHLKTLNIRKGVFDNTLYTRGAFENTLRKGGWF